MKVRKAIIPVAGFGTRMLPVTKSIPKEMLPLVDKPMIHFIVDECVQAGITDIILVDHSLKTAVGNYFDVNYELEDKLKKKNKIDLLNEAQLDLPKKITLASVRQGEAKGLGHAILCARYLVGEEPFAILLPDVLIEEKFASDVTTMKLMVEQYENLGSSQVLVETVPDDAVSSYGIVSLSNDEERVIKDIVEKPSLKDAPSRLAVCGRYVLSPAIWKHLEKQGPGVGGEIQLTDAIHSLLKEQQVIAYELLGKRWDCGSKQGYVDTFLHFAQKRGFIKN